MFAATLRKWFGVQSNYYDSDYKERTICGRLFNRHYEISLNQTKGLACHYSANSKGEFVLRIYKFFLMVHLRKKPISMTFDANHDAPQWGFALTDGPDILLYSGQEPATPTRSAHTKTRLIPVPFSWRSFRTYQFAQFSPDTPAHWADITDQPIPKEYHRVWQQSFTYTTKHGEVQEGLATMTITKRVFRRAWLRWLAWERSERYLRIEFNREVGHDRSGWKGGVFGTSFLLKEHESPPKGLQRAIEEHHFG